ncbi:winged helix-turn-helix domain-containing protein [Metabacillus fastidiosus]|uniref:Winged helix-turn-helix domain-containing protein n=1 Tax=Metabacillus fastidiosus TaxID=1458 RepID=A0ABU6NSS7_9BACI|nr:winged helix-turn-helix domain-containing protein [Metabacillus fastidiosus]
MDNKILDLIYEISDNFNSDYEKTGSSLYKLTEIFSELIWNKKFEEIIDIQQTLDDELINIVLKDNLSYNLGKAHTLIELANALNRPYQVQELLNTLTPIEKELLKIIELNQEITPTKIKEHLNESKQYVSNLLSNLRKKELVNSYAVGKFRWYSISLKGKDLLSLIRNELNEKTISQLDTEKFKQPLTKKLENDDLSIDNDIQNIADSIATRWYNSPPTDENKGSKSNIKLALWINDKRTSDKKVNTLKAKQQNKYSPSKKINKMDQLFMSDWSEPDETFENELEIISMKQLVTAINQG